MKNSLALAVLSLVAVLGLGSVAQAIEAPQTCTIMTSNGHYLTAVGGGGRTTNVLHTDATRVGSWENFVMVDTGEGSALYGFKTANGHYLTAVGGGGRTTDVFHSDATKLQAWEKIMVQALGGGSYALKTINGHYVTATGGGGHTSDAVHTDATRVGSWEKFYLRCHH
jgi:hypothetical protein